MTDVVSKLWGFCHTLRHDGIDYGDYIEQDPRWPTIRSRRLHFARTGWGGVACFEVNRKLIEKTVYHVSAAKLGTSQ